MPKYICIKTDSNSVPLGTIITATPIENNQIQLTQDSDLTISEQLQEPYFSRGQVLPLNGQIWHWEEVKDL